MCSLIKKPYMQRIYPLLQAIDTFSGARSGKIKADFFDDC